MDEISDKIAESIKQVLTESGVTKFEVKVKSPNNIECLFVQPAIVENVTFVVSKPSTEVAPTDEEPDKLAKATVSDLKERGLLSPLYDVDYNIII